MTAENNYAVGVTLKEKHWRHLTVCPKDFYASLHRNTDSAGRKTIYSFIEFAIVSTILQDLLQLYWAFSFLHIFVRASSLVWVKQTSWIEQTGCISCDWQMNTHPVCDERRRPTEYVIVSLHVCVFSQQLRLWFRVFRHCELQQERDYGLLLGNSLQIACISLDWLYCPCGDVIPAHIGKHAHTWAQVCTHAHTHVHTPTHIQTETTTLP